MSLGIRPVRYDPDLFAPMLQEAERDDGAFLLRLHDEWVGSVLRFDGEGEILLGAFLDAELIGVGGISRDPYRSEPGLGRLRHLYVVKRHRGRGVGGELARRLIEHARLGFGKLRLRTESPAAARLNERLGFVPELAPEQTHGLALRQTS